MKTKNVFYILIGFLIGLVFAGVFSVVSVRAQLSSSFDEEEMSPAVPVTYGKLVAVSGLDLYFQANDGTVHIVRPRTNKELESRVTVIPRSQ